MLDLEGFRQYLYEEELARNTVQSYLHALKIYAAKHDDITKADLIEFKREQLSRYKPATVNLRIAALLSYCRFARLPMRLKAVKLPKRTSVENVITPEQLNTLLQGLEKDGDRCWRTNILLLSKTGMRISEAVRITKRDIMSGSVTLNAKDHMRTIYFPDKLVDAIRDDLAGLAPNDLVVRGRWHNTKGTKPITEGGFRSSLKTLGERYGIPQEVMHPHSFRHRFAIEFLKRKNDIALLADLLGHSRIDMTRIYLRQSQETQKDAVNEAVDW
jgi:integrase